MKNNNKHVEISVVVPIFNEEDNIDVFFERLTNVMDSIEKTYEIIFIDDGSVDKSNFLLENKFRKRPDVIRVITLNNNYGQYCAILAGFEYVRGDVIVTLDADLQNPPEDITKLLFKIDEGYDLVGGYREERNDNFFRTYCSKILNFCRKKITSLDMRDHGCMLRAYKKSVIDKVVDASKLSTFVTLLAQKFATNPIDIPVRHEARLFGNSKYNFFNLVKISFDLFTGFSIVPLQIYTMFSVLIFMFSTLYFFIELIRTIMCINNNYGMCFSIIIWMISVLMIGIGLIGEYIGRTHFAACDNPRFVIKSIRESIN